MRHACLCILCTALVSATQQTAAEEKIIEEVVVTAHPLSGEGLAQAATILEGDELADKVAYSIGDTLAREAGVHSSTFGQAVGRPVIHGLGGPRVRVMEDRIDSLDVSVTSADHAVTVEPFIAERVEILKGSSTLLYGEGAIGGVVDVHTNRIPHSVPDRLSGGIETRYDDNGSGQTTAAKLNGGAGGFAWHFDGALKDGDDYDIPGFAESARLRAAEEAEHEEEEEEEHEEEHEEEAEARGELPGSAYDTESYAGGVSYVGDWGFVGVAVSRLEAEYGLPGGHGHEEEHEEGEEEEEHEEEEHGEEGNPLVDLEQTRIDLELGIQQPFGPFSSLNVRLGINDYEHKEIEPNGEVATRFKNEAWELRGELVYEGDAWQSVFGFQHSDREFSAAGEEAFIAPVDTTSTGVFWLAQIPLGGVDLEGGLRLGRVSHDPSVGSDEDFSTGAASVGLVLNPSDQVQVGVLLDYSTRAPIAEELYSNGPHLATNAFEVGDPDLDSERALGLSATVKVTQERFYASATAYVTRFSDFIYQQANGAEEDGLPVFVYLQDDADFYGIDVEVLARVSRWDEGGFSIRGMLDFVEGEIDRRGDQDVPRIPPLRYGVGLMLDHGRWSASIDYTHNAKQDNVAPTEFETDSYEDLRAQISWNYPFDAAQLGLFVRGRNLTDDEQRHHASFIKDFAPAPGRSVEVGARLTF